MKVFLALPGAVLFLSMAMHASEPTRTTFFSYVGVVDCDGVAIRHENIYLACHSSGDQLPLAAQGTPAIAGSVFAYVLQFSPRTGRLIYATRFGGHGYTAAFRIKVDDSGVAYVAGTTDAKDFPATADAVEREPGGGRDAFFAKLAPDGRILYATFLGGDGVDEGYGLELDGHGGAYLAGPTSSTNLPGQTEKREARRSDAFVAHIEPDNPRSFHSVVFGGSKDDRLAGIASDAGGGLYAVGTSKSPDFPSVGGTTSPFRGESKVFLTRLDKATLQPTFSRLFGGSGDDSGWGIVVSKQGDVIVSGTTSSSDLPGSAGGFQSRRRGGTDAFVTKFSGSGYGVISSTYLGGEGDDASGFDGDDIKVDGAGHIWLAGSTASPDFPLRDALHSKYAGKRDGFVAALSPDLSKLCFATYLGEAGGGNLEGLDFSRDSDSVVVSGFSFTDPIGASPLVDAKSPTTFRLNGETVHTVVLELKARVGCE